jgi:hypothetical protein
MWTKREHSNISLDKHHHQQQHLHKLLHANNHTLRLDRRSDIIVCMEVGHMRPTFEK